MKAFVEFKNNFPINVDIQNAIDGFEYLDYDVVKYNKIDVLTGKLNESAKTNVFVGSIDTMSILFKNLNKYPTPIDFPNEILHLMNRSIQITDLDTALNIFKETGKPIFIKPVETKLFDGMLLTKPQYMNYFSGFDNPQVYVGDKIDIVSEHRAYIHNGEMIYCCNYSGDFKINPDYNYINSLIRAYKSAPVAYTIDVAVLKDGTMTVVEFNDFWSIGTYGLYCIKYANMLNDRYFEIVA